MCFPKITATPLEDQKTGSEIIFAVLIIIEMLADMHASDLGGKEDFSCRHIA